MWARHTKILSIWHIIQRYVLSVVIEAGFASGLLPVAPGFLAKIVLHPSWNCQVFISLALVALSRASTRFANPMINGGRHPNFISVFFWNRQGHTLKPPRIINRSSIPTSIGFQTSGILQSPGLKNWDWKKPPTMFYAINQLTATRALILLRWIVDSHHFKILQIHNRRIPFWFVYMNELQSLPWRFWMFKLCLD